uniref:Uncharacterized protein n=1 Tax=Zea mays TaxID=4577 RepID=C0PNW4_MAIZE|nr:unknown [Zea mays]
MQQLTSGITVSTHYRIANIQFLESTPISGFYQDPVNSLHTRTRPQASISQARCDWP